MLPLPDNSPVPAPVRDPAFVRLLRFCYVSRRKFATGAAVLLAAFIAFHAIAGPNGLIAYRAKRSQEAALASQIAALQKENDRLNEHNQRLQQDPAAIEGAVRKHLHYAKPNEVILTVPEDTDSTSSTGTKTK